MSATLSTEEERALRERFDVIVRVKVKHAANKLHLPDHSIDEIESLCGLKDNNRSVRELEEKDLDVYPVGYRDFCSQCLGVLEALDA